MIAIARSSFAAFCLVAAVAVTVHAQGAAAPGDAAVPFFTGPQSDIQVGTFPGKLVCLSCDLGGPGGKEQCGKVGHRHALLAADGSMVHPLIPGTEEVLARINSNELHGKKVKVHGKYYPALGSILVDRVEPVS
jgi:hypothetical protein